MSALWMLSTLASVPKAGGETGSSMRCITSSSSARTMPASRSASPLTACLRHQTSSALSAGRGESAPQWTSRDLAQQWVAWGLTGHETRHCCSHRLCPLNAAGTGTVQRTQPPGWGWDPLAARLGHLDGVTKVAAVLAPERSRGHARELWDTPGVRSPLAVEPLPPALTLLEGIEDVDEGEVVSVRVEQGPPAHGHGLLQVGGGGHKAGGSWG